MKKSDSGLWKHGLVLTLLFGFTAMLVGGAYIYKTRAPIPTTVVSAGGDTLFTSGDIQAGQELFRKHNLMNYGSVLGHGAYLGPDYTAEVLHWMTDSIRDQKSNGRFATMSTGESSPKNRFSAASAMIRSRPSGSWTRTYCMSGPTTAATLEMSVHGVVVQTMRSASSSTRGKRT